MSFFADNLSREGMDKNLRFLWLKYQGSFRIFTKETKDLPFPQRHIRWSFLRLCHGMFTLIFMAYGGFRKIGFPYWDVLAIQMSTQYIYSQKKEGLQGTKDITAFLLIGVYEWIILT